MPECKVFSKCAPLRERVEKDKKAEAEIRAKLEVNGHEESDAQSDEEKDSSGENRRFAWHALPFASVGAIRYLDCIRKLKLAREEIKDWEEFDETSGCYDDLEEVSIKVHFTLWHCEEF